jgi:hypothetical protein
MDGGRPWLEGEGSAGLRLQDFCAQEELHDAAGARYASSVNNARPVQLITFSAALQKHARPNTPSEVPPLRRRLCASLRQAVNWIGMDWMSSERV